MADAEWESRLPPNFLKYVDRSGECWIWTGHRSTTGYGRVTVNGVGRQAHRVAYEAYHGRPIPEGLFACHNCPGGDNRACVNPAHVWEGTQRENILDAYNKGFKNDNARLTHCRKGHPLEGPNLHVRIDRPTARVCQTCHRDYSLAYRKRQKEQRVRQ